MLHKNIALSDRHAAHNWEYAATLASAQRLTVTAPKQDAKIQWQLVMMSNELREQIKSQSSICKLIYNEMQQRIRNKYPIEEEMYFSRIGIGVALGVYAFQPGEQDALIAYGDFVESVRQWGRTEREKIGL